MISKHQQNRRPILPINLLIHHHAVAFQDSKGIWISSFMGRWISELAKHFQNLGLLLRQSKTKLASQDTCINASNVKLHSFGSPGNVRDRVTRTLKLKRVCRNLKGQYDVLIIRGITPRQALVWKSIEIKRKYFLIVGSLEYNYKRFLPKDLSGGVQWFIERQRRRELISMLKTGTLLVNSLHTFDEAMHLLSIHSVFAPTNTIKENEFCEFAIRKLNQPLSVLFCGRIEQKKGLRELLEAIKSLLDMGKEVRLSLVGSIADNEFHSSLKDFITKFNMEDAVLFTGHVNYGHELFEQFRSADIFVLPSYTEGFPHVIWEAAANCCPIITTPVGGIPYLIKDEETALFIERKNPKAIVTAIERIITNEELRSCIIKNAYILAKEFTVEKCVDKLSSIIKSGYDSK